jgi:hypothetical protein
MVVRGAPAATGEMQPGGSPGADPSPALPARSAGHDAAVHRVGRRICRASRPTGRAAGHTPHRSQATAACVPTAQGRDAGDPAWARPSRLQRPQCSAPGTLPRLWGSGQRWRPLSLLCLGPAMGPQMAHSARRETPECQLAALHPAPGRQPHRAAPPHRGEASTRVRLSARLARSRVRPRHRMRDNGTSGSVRGAPGNRRPYRGGGQILLQFRRCACLKICRPMRAPFPRL